jgi:hypothetical protein
VPEINCPKCGHALNEDALNASSLTKCNTCGVELRAEVFPAIERQRDTGIVNEAVTTGSEAGCFYHPDKKALTHCAMCGRFLCALCDLEINDQHLCAACLAIGQKRNTIVNLENHRILYDKIALFLAVVPFTVVLWFFSILTTPATIFVVIRYWKTPGSIMSDSKLRFVLAFMFAGIQMFGWVAFIISLSG